MPVSPRRRPGPVPRALAVPLGLAVALAAGCHTPVDDSGVPPAVDYSAPGAYAVGRHTAQLDDLDRGRSLTIETWYPSDTAAQPTPIEDLAVDPSDRSTYAALLAAAPAGCPSLTTSASVDTAASTAPDAGWPVVLMSHCHDCTRWSTVTTAERLASRGFVVVAPDHAGNTLFDALAGTGLPLDTDTLALREGDVDFSLAAALSGQLVDGLPLNADAVGVFGHSFGGVIDQGLAIKHPEKVDLVVTYESPTPWVLHRELNRPALTDDARYEAEHFFTRMVSRKIWDRLSEEERESRRLDGEGLLSDLQELRYNAPFDITELQTPSAYIHGDGIIGEYYIALCKELNKVVPSMKTIAIEKANHGAHLQNPDQLSELITSLWGQTCE